MKFTFAAVGIMIVLIGQAALGVPVASAAEPGSSAKAALRNNSFPWYDVQKDSFRSLRPRKAPPPERMTQDSTPINPGSSVAGAFIHLMMWILLGVVLAVMAVAAYFAIKNMKPVLEQQTDAPTITVTLEQLEALPETARGVRDLLGEATRLAAQAQYGPAMVFYHSWQLVQLDKRGALELQKGKTNRRYLSEVSESAPELTDLFQRSIRLFEDAFFGSLEVRKDEFEGVWNQRHSFESASRRAVT